VAVEEQFYLFWPLLMLFLPKRSLLACIIFFICIGVVGQATISDREFGSIQLHTSFDCLGMGALLAWMVVYRAEYLPRFYTFIRLVGLVSLAVIGCKVAGVLPAGQTSVFIGVLTMWAILYILISGAQGSGLGFVLNNKLLINIGKVSYGLYLYHVLFGFFMGRIWDNISHTFSLSITTHAYYLICLINFIILFFFCWLSFKYH
jgi:peptidoglycan/LPS O-acetylase OafA/YrhL